MKRQRLIDFYDKPRTNGIFHDMSLADNDRMFNFFVNLFPNDGEIDVSQVHAADMDYLLNHSGFKTISTLLEYIANGYVIDDMGDYATIIKCNKLVKVSWDYVIQQVDKDLINDVIITKYLSKWEKLYDTTTLQFDALSPYSMTVSDIVKFNGNYSNDDNVTIKSNNKDDGKITAKGNSNSSTYGFNSYNAVPTDSNESSNDNTTHNDSTFSGTNIKKSTSGKNTSTNRDITRKGNIGNKSAMQLIEEQRSQLRYIILTEIYNDLDEILTRSKYIL